MVGIEVAVGVVMVEEEVLEEDELNNNVSIFNSLDWEQLL